MGKKALGRIPVKLCIVFLSIVWSEAVEPGAKIRISQNGLNYAASCAIDILTQNLQGITLPDLKDTAPLPGGQIAYEVKNIKIAEIRRPATGATLSAGQGLSWFVSDLYVKVTCEFSYTYRMFIMQFADHGTIEAVGDKMSAVISAKLGRNNMSGGLTAWSTDCLVNIQKLNIQVQGGVDWFYNIVLQFVEGNIRTALEEVLSKEARKAVDVNAAGELATLPVTALLLNEWMIDYQLLAEPVFTSTFIQSVHKGEFFQVGDTTEAPFQAAALPDPPGTERMVNVWLSDYMLNTVGYVLYKRDILHYTLSAENLDNSARGYLDVSCSETVPTCIGSFLPQVKKLYPNASVELEMKIDQAPSAVISPAGMEGRMEGSIVYRARQPDASLVYLFTTKVSAILSVLPRLNTTNVAARVEKIKAQLDVTESAVGNVSNANLNFVFNGAASKFIQKKLNEVGERGFPLPIVKHVKLYNDVLTLHDHAIGLSLDVQYSP